MKIPRRGQFRSHSIHFESLEARQLLTADLVASAPVAQIAPLVPHRNEQLRLASLSNELIENQYVEITNESDFQARFAMTVNGNISRNTQHLVQQIRGMAITGEQEMPDYRKAFYFVMQYHQHDFPFTNRLWTHEPSLYLNSIGAGLCDDAATALKLIWQEMGYESRVWLLNGHVVSEVFSGDRWEMYDADLRVLFYNRHGQVAGVQELAASPELITNPTNPTSANPYVYSPRMASIFATTENNKICTQCDDHVVERDLIFEIPAGGTMSWGQTFTTKPLPTIVVETATKLGQLKVTIPAGSTGTLDIPLAIYDIQGAAMDSVTMNGETMSLGDDAPFAFLNRDTVLGNRVQTIEFQSNAQPIDVIYMFNERFAGLLDNNEVEIEHVTSAPATLRASMKKVEATKWDFGEGQRFDGSTNNLDLSNATARELISANSSFEMNARIRLDDGEASRRPIFDAFRFALEIDAQNRPYVYFRQASDVWAGIRGTPLSSDTWHDLRVSYRLGDLSLSVDGNFVGSLAAQPISEAYALLGPYIGKSQHMGGLFFQGEMSSVSIHQVYNPATPPEFEIIPVDGLLGGVSGLRGRATHAVAALDQAFVQMNIANDDEQDSREKGRGEAMTSRRTRRRLT